MKKIKKRAKLTMKLDQKNGQTMKVGDLKIQTFYYKKIKQTEKHPIKTDAKAIKSNRFRTSPKKIFKLSFADMVGKPGFLLTSSE